ncbi:hypothetical protein F5051DRAFT_447777, partial [Lentinula edodes]
PGAPIDEDEDEIIREALARVERVKARKAAEAAKRKAAEEAAAKKAAEEAEKKKQEDEVVERRRKLAEAATARSQGGTSTGDVSASPRRPIVEISKMKNKGKGKAKAPVVDEDPDDGDDDDEDEEDREPCERCRSKKIPCLKQAGKRSSVICKPCHDSKVRCSYSGRPYVVKKDGGAGPSGERLAVLESQMAQLLADNRALREANSKTQQYLRQLLRRQEDDHTHLISMDTRMSLMGMGEGPAAAGPSRRTTERRRPLKRRRVVEESEEGREEEEEVEEREKETEKDGEGEEEEIVEEEMAPTEARADKGKEKEVVE